MTIVGAGASGTLAAIHLLRRASVASVTLVERVPHAIARGVAYGCSDLHLPLNVRAGAMSIDPADPGHFVRWNEARGTRVADGGVLADAYLPRRLYGDYLGESLRSAIRASNVDVSIVHDEAVSIDRSGERVKVSFDAHAPIESDAVVLALGNFPRPAGGDACVALGWDADALDGIGLDDPVAFVGAGLSTIDQLLRLDRMGHRGPIVVISRHGRFPEAHADAPIERRDAGAIVGGRRSPRALVRAIREFVAAEPDRPWQASVDGLRPYVQAIWGGWSEAERRAFLRHVRNPWEAHRHRLPPASAALVARLFREGRLTLIAGRAIDTTCEDDDTVTVVALRGGGTTTVRTSAAVDCTGPASDYGTIDDAFVRSLVDSGTVVPDALKLGILTDDRGRVVRRDGAVDPRILAIGPPRKGTLWESTAIGEIREQAAALAETLVGASRELV